MGALKILGESLTTDFGARYFFQNFMGFCSDGTAEKSVGEFL